MSLWYLRRAVPWAALLGGLLAAGLLLGAAHLWESFNAVALSLVALLGVAAAAFVYDEPAIAVTSVTPRGHRWAGSSRLAVGGAALAVTLGLLLLSPGDVHAPDWALVLAGLGGTVVLLALAGSRRQLPRPGAAIAPGVVLLGMAPMVLGLLFELRSPFPLSPLNDGLTAFWSAATVVSILTGTLQLSRPLGSPRTREYPGRDVTGVPANVTTTGASR